MSIIRYHVFWDHHDEWFDDEDLAMDFYASLGDINKRLYVEEYNAEVDYLAGIPTIEECLLAHGDYPL